LFVWTSTDSERDGGFASGLIAGDGHFAIHPTNGETTWQCHLAVQLRADDTPLLAELCRWSGAGMLQAVPARRTSRPQTTWIVQRQADCLRMVSILDRYPLLGKKLGQYEIWREAILAWTGPGSGRYAVMAECGERLCAHRAADVLAGASAVSITDDVKGHRKLRQFRAPKSAPFEWLGSAVQAEPRSGGAWAAGAIPVPRSLRR
jgi:hypothetical protein